MPATDGARETLQARDGLGGRFGEPLRDDQPPQPRFFTQLKRIMRNISIAFCSVFLLLALTAHANVEESVPAFPGAEGFGAYPKGGRGGRVIAVTNLDDFDPETEAPIPGSFRAACMAAGPRNIVFRLSGNIRLVAPLYITEPYITIAGQTAPGDGISISGDVLGIGTDIESVGGRGVAPAAMNHTHDVVVRHLRIRCGPGRRKGHEPDALAINDAHNVIIDHCSISWAVDEVVAITAHPNVWLDGHQEGDPIGRTYNVTVQWCIVAEGLKNSTHSRGAHSKGLMVAYGPSRITLHHNLIAHNSDRNPYLPSEGEEPYILDVRNNLVYNWEAAGGIAYRKTNRDGRFNFIGNLYIKGPDSADIAALNMKVPAEVFAFDNIGPTRKDPDMPQVKAVTGAARLVDQPFSVPPVTTHPARELEAILLEKVGAILPRRDTADGRLVTEVRERKGRIIDDPEDVGGWPELTSAEAPADTDGDGMPDDWEKRHELDPKNPADGHGDADGDGYTNLEEYFNATDPHSPDLMGR